MKLEVRVGRRRRAAWTLVEAALGIVLFTLLMAAAYQVFSHYVRASLKGQDTMTSVREALQVLEDIRREAMAASNVASPTPRLSEGATPVDLSDPGHALCLLTPEGTLLYRLATDAQGLSFLHRSLTQGGQVQNKALAIGRVRDFLVYWIVQRQVIAGGLFVTRCLSVTLVLQGDVVGLPATELKVSTLIGPPFAAFADSSWP